MITKIAIILITISLYGLLNMSHASDPDVESSNTHKRKYVVLVSEQPVVEPDQLANLNSIHLLPSESIVHVLAELSIYDIINCSRVNVVWHKAYELLLDSTHVPMFSQYSYSFKKSGENYKIPNIDDREFFLNLMLNLNSLVETQAIPEEINAYPEYYDIEEKEEFDEHKNLSSQEELERRYKFFAYKDVLKNLEDTVFAPQPQPFIVQGVEQHYAALHRWYHKMPANHRAITNVNLGHMYEHGHGVKICYYTAFNHYIKARQVYEQLNQDYLFPTECLTGIMHIKIGEAQTESSSEAADTDFLMAEDSFRQAIEKDYLEGYYRLGLLYTTNNPFMTELNHEAEGVELLKQAAQRGHAGAQCSLSWIYTHGIDVISKESSSFNQRWVLAPDYPQALEYCQQAVAQNYAGGYYHLGYLYNFGKGVERDYQQAQQCYQKAADQGHQHAQYRLGVLFEEGLGVEPDARRAFEYYQQSATKNYDRALLALARMCEEGEGVEQDYPQAFHWYEKLTSIYCYEKSASQDGYYIYRKETSRDYSQSRVHAEYKLGHMLECGLGTEQDLQKACDWYKHVIKQLRPYYEQATQKPKALKECSAEDNELVSEEDDELASD